MVALAVSCFPDSPAAAGQADRWTEARNHQFAAVSNIGEEHAEGLFQQLERARTMLELALADARVDPRGSAVLLAVGDQHGIRELLPQFWERKGQRPVAAYWRGPYRHCILVRADISHLEQYRRILHEYVHLLAHENIGDIPAWLDEGLSEFWSTAIVEDEAVEVGSPASKYLRVLRGRRAWIPFDELLAMARAPDARDRQQLSLFYAQAWALTHYLLLGGSSTRLVLAPSKYVDALHEDGDPILAANAAFGGVTELERAVREYVRRGRFRTVRVWLPPLRSAPGPTGRPDGMYVRPLSVAQSLALRAGCVVDGERPAAAVPLLTRALAADPNEPTVLETLGYFHFQQNNPTEAAAWFDRAIAAGSTSHLAYFYRAILAGAIPVRLPPSRFALRRTGKPDATSGGEPVDAERLLRRAIDLRDGFAPAYARLADIHIQRADRLHEALSLLRRATELEPENAAYWVQLGKLLVQLNRPADAQEAVDRGLALVESARDRQLLEAFRRGLTF